MAYIQSEDWAAVRRVFWSKHKRECARCGATTNLHVHHMTYERFKKERLSDLIGLCQKCHSLVHHYHNQHGGSLHEATIKIVSTKRVVAKKIAKPKKRKVTPYVPAKPLIPVEITRRPIPKKSKAAKIKANDDAYKAALERRRQLEQGN